MKLYLCQTFQGPICLLWSWLQLRTSCLLWPLGQHENIMHFHQLLCPGPFCELCNSATAEVNWLPFQEDLGDATPSVSPRASTTPVTESSFTLSLAFSVVPPRDPNPAFWPEPFPPPPPPIPLPDPMTLQLTFFRLHHQLTLCPQNPFLH